MAYRMIIHTKDSRIVSPIIAPDDPTHDMNNHKIADSINRFGISLLKYDKTVTNFKIART